MRQKIPPQIQNKGKLRCGGRLRCLCPSSSSFWQDVPDILLLRLYHADLCVHEASLSPRRTDTLWNLQLLVDSKSKCLSSYYKFPIRSLLHHSASRVRQTYLFNSLMTCSFRCNLIQYKPSTLEDSAWDGSQVGETAGILAIARQAAQNLEQVWLLWAWSATAARRIFSPELRGRLKLSCKSGRASCLDLTGFPIATAQRVDMSSILREWPFHSSTDAWLTNMLKTKAL